jgi:predicted  nucleic acid-binding Zn-ribbon protein
MKSFLERFDEIDAELSILRTQIAKIESELKAIEKRRARTND